MTRRGGFTLVELLIVASIMTFVSGVIVATLTGGFRVWARASDYGVHEQAGLIAFEGIRRDVSNARQFVPIPFEGSASELSFAAVAPYGDPSAQPELGQLGYYVDLRRGLLCRSFIPYRLMQRMRLRDRCEVVLETVQKARFDYYGDEAGSGDASWGTSWDAAAARPSVLKLTTTVEAGRGQSAVRTLMVALPGGAPAAEAAK